MEEVFKQFAGKMSNNNMSLAKSKSKNGGKSISKIKKTINSKQGSIGSVSPTQQERCSIKNLGQNNTKAKQSKVTKEKLITFFSKSA